MKVRWGPTTWLADDDRPASDIQIDDQMLVQDAQYIRAAVVNLFARGNRAFSLSFTVQKSFASVRLAQEFMLNNRNTLANFETMVLRLGAFGETPSDATVPAAVMQSVSARFAGVAVFYTYNIRAPQVTGITFNPTTEDLRTGTVSIPSGVSSLAVSGLALPGVPDRVIATVRKPSGGFNLFATVVDGTIDADGFDVVFSGTTNLSTYKLDYVLSI